jgi:hypothetical protein
VEVSENGVGDRQQQHAPADSPTQQLVYNFCKFSNQTAKHIPVPGSLDKKGGRRCQLLLNKRWHLLPPFSFNEPGSGF